MTRKCKYIDLHHSENLSHQATKVENGQEMVCHKRKRDMPATKRRRHSHGEINRAN